MAADVWLLLTVKVRNLSRDNYGLVGTVVKTRVYHWCTCFRFSILPRLSAIMLLHLFVYVYQVCVTKL